MAICKIDELEENKAFDSEVYEEMLMEIKVAKSALELVIDKISAAKSNKELLDCEVECDSILKNLKRVELFY